MSLADEPQLGTVRAEIARRHDDDARMALLSRLCARGYGGTDPKHIPEEEMARADTLRLQVEVARLAEACRREAGLPPLLGNDRAIADAERELAEAKVVSRARAARPGAAPAASAPSAAGTSEELTMPRGVRATPCPGCGSKATNHKDCDGPPRRANGVAAAPAAEPEPEPVADTGPERIDEDLAALTVEQLVSLRRQVDAELVTRGDRLRAELKAIEAACGAAVEAAS
jgi:hypothetical protein